MNDIPPAGASSLLDIRIDEKTHFGANGTPVPAVRGFALGLQRDALTVLMGPSGCGKTTILRILAGLDTRYRGHVSFPKDMRIGMMFQEPRLLPWRTVRQNVMLTADDGFDEAAFTEICDRLGITETFDRFPSELSLGLARRVALARAYATRPQLLLLDEPFVSLDEPTANRLRRLLLEVWSARPTTAVLVTHNPREAVELADTLVLVSPRPTHVVEEIPITLPRGERTPEAVQAYYQELRAAHPHHFTALE